MQLEFAAEVQRLANTEGHGVVELEGVVGGLVLVLRVTACQVGQAGATGTAEGVGRLGGGRTVVQLVGEGDRLGVLLVEEALVVEASAERGTGVLHICFAVVTEVRDIIAAHHGGGATSALHRHGVELGRCIDGAHLVELIA